MQAHSLRASRVWRDHPTMSAAARPVALRRMTPRSRLAFTLIELVVTCLLLSMLATAVTVTGLSVINGGYDKSAQHSAQVVAAEATAYYSTYSAFPSCTAINCAAMTSVESSFTYVYGTPSTGVSTSATQVSVSVNTGSTPATFTAAVLSQSGTCFLIQVTPPSNSTADLRTSTPGTCYGGLGVGSGAAW